MKEMRNSPFHLYLSPRAFYWKVSPHTISIGKQNIVQLVLHLKKCCAYLKPMLALSVRVDLNVAGARKCSSVVC